MFIIFTYPLRMINRRINYYKRKTMKGVEVLRDSAITGAMLGLIIATIILVSIWLYVQFYVLYMPSLSHTRQVHLQFTACETEKGICSFPAAHVQLTKKHQLLMIGQRYKIHLNLEMPESPTNTDLGMFMVCARMVDKGGVLVSNSCRATMLHHRSQFLKFLYTCAYSFFFLFGSKEEKQTILVELYSDFEDRQGHQVTDIYLEVQSRFIELYSASLHIQAHLSGLRYLMFHWPLLSTMLGVSTNFFILAFIFYLSWPHIHEYVCVQYGQNVEELTPENQFENSSDESVSNEDFFKTGTSEELRQYVHEEE